MIQPVSYISCGTKYFEYPIVTDVYLGDASNVSESFPTITICLNSMHSRQKIEQFHNSDDKLVSALRTGSGSSISLCHIFKNQFKVSFMGFILIAMKLVKSKLFKKSNLWKV